MGSREGCPLAGSRKAVEFCYGGIGGDRTRDRWLKRPLLYQLSYDPICDDFWRTVQDGSGSAGIIAKFGAWIKVLPLGCVFSPFQLSSWQELNLLTFFPCPLFLQKSSALRWIGSAN